MSGVLNVDTIADNAGTGPVTLTKQAAVKAHIAYNLSGTTYFGLGNNTASAQSFGVSSTTDAGTAQCRHNLTSSMSSNSYTYLMGAPAANNVCCIAIESTTSELRTFFADADSGTNNDFVNYSAILGDLA
jgi:hypothetical protein